MPLRLVSRPGEDGAVDALLERAQTGPSGLVLEGEAGIGKTTVWLHAVDLARQRGFTVLSTRTAETESVLSYAGLADLLGSVDGAVREELPPLLKRALERVLLFSDDGSQETDQRAVAAGFLMMIETLAQQGPVLIAIDDLQWLDASSVHAVAFAVRRLRGRVGVLGSERIDLAAATACSWLQLPFPEALTRIRVRPLSLGGLTAVVSGRLGWAVSRPKMVRIAEISGGNPFYALELARVMGAGPAGAAVRLPSTLSELVDTRIASITAEVSDVLLAAACATSPTIELIARAVSEDADRVAKLLEDAADQGLVVLERQQIRFTHPLLARGVYARAGRTRRRALHRRLAGLVDEPELQARHLALASVRGEPKTLAALDNAARIARARGAPAEAAELLDLALGLGGDTPERRIRSAQYHCDAGDFTQAQDMLQETVDALAPGAQRAEAMSQLAAVAVFGSDFRRAAHLLEAALHEVGDDTTQRAQILVTLAFAQFNTGRMPAAARTVESAVEAAAAADQPELLCQALSLRTNQRFLRGQGLDRESLARALELESADLRMPMAFRPSVQNASFLSWTGQLEAARTEYAQLQQRCVERGEENDLLHLTFNSFQVEVWLGNLTGAADIAKDSLERARQLGGDLPLAMALTMRALLASLTGRESDTRADAGAALTASMRCGAHILAMWPLTALGLLEVTLGNHDAALETLKPLLTQLDTMADATEIITAGYVPDAAEAMVQVGRLDEAEELIDRLERNGRRLDRAWMMAVGARCRSMLLAAQGDIARARGAAQSALIQHDRLPMPFERARTLLVLGQLQRRQRRREPAAVSIREALDIFEELGCALWAERARAELARVTVARGPADGQLTESERRIAELAASGLTNREIAATLFISPKTVEVNLSRVYRKLGIRSRAELARRIDRRDSR